MKKHTFYFKLKFLIMYGFVTNPYYELLEEMISCRLAAGKYLIDEELDLVRLQLLFI